MKPLLSLALLLFALPLTAQAPDQSPDHTHKKSHERTPYYAKDGKTRCGVLMELRDGRWRAWLDQDRHPVFETKAEAAQWLAVYCPVAGKAGHD